MKRLVIITPILVLLLAFFSYSYSINSSKNTVSSSLAEDTQVSNSLTGYTQHEIHGWRVMIADAVNRDQSLYQRILKQIDQDLYDIVQVVPVKKLTYLRQTPIWFEKIMPPPFKDNLFFNGSKKGSKKHQIEHLYGGVVAGSTKAYLAVAHIHPWQMLHELTLSLIHI